MLPFNAKDITEQFLISILEPQSKSVRSFAFLNSVGIILSHLPKIFHQQIYERSILSIKQDKLMIAFDYSKKVLNHL